MTEEYQVWSIDVKIPRGILRHNKARIKEIFDRFREELEELRNPYALGYFKINPSQVKVTSRLVKP